MGEPARHSGLGAYGDHGRDGRARDRRAGRVAGRLAVVAAGFALLLAGPQSALGAAPARPALAATVSAEYPVIVTIEDIAPAVATPSGTVTITGQVTNGGRSALKSPHAAVRAPLDHRPLTRSELGSVASRNDPAGVDGVDLPSPQAALNELGPGQSQQFTLQIAVADLELGREGAYELAVDVRGWTADNQRERPLGIARTFLPYNPTPGAAQPTQVAALWPLTHTPELVAQTLSESDQSIPVLRDDSLAGEFSPGGRLYELVEIGAGLPALTWVVDPDLLDTAYAMAGKSYRVQKPNTAGQAAKEENTTAGTGKDAATAWLEKLRAAVAKQGNEVVALPYADPDIASIAHNGADLPGIDTALRKAGTAGQVTAEGRLSVDVRSDVAWPYQGYLDQQIAATAQRGGDNLLLVNGASLPEPDSLKYTPGAVRPIGNGQTAVVADSTVSELFQSDLNTPQVRSAAVQRFLAETFVITHQEPNNPRGLLVMPPRTLTVNSAKALAEALNTSRTGQWTAPAKLDAVAQAAADPKANGAVPSATDYPAEARASELSADALTQTMDVQRDLDLLMRVLTQPQKVRGPFGAAMARSVSTEWRPEGPAGDSYRTGVTKYLAELSKQIRLVEKSVTTFAGDTGVLQVSLRNDLAQTVTNLRLVLTSSQPNRLKVGDAADIVLGASRSVTLQFPAEAHNNGQATMTAQLWTTGPDPQKYGKAVTFNVMVTSVTDGVLYVIGGGLVLILLAALRIYLKRKKGPFEPYDPDALLEDPTDDPTGDPQDDPQDGPPAGRPDEDRDPPQDGDDGSVQTLRGTTADGRNRTTGDEKVGP